MICVQPTSDSSRELAAIGGRGGRVMSLPRSYDPPTVPLDPDPTTLARQCRVREEQEVNGIQPDMRGDGGADRPRRREDPAVADSGGGGEQHVAGAARDMRDPEE